MKRSEFVAGQIETLMRLLGCGPAQAATASHAAAREAEKAGVTWDPEEPEVLWEAPESRDVYATRILIDGTVEYLSSLRGWLPMDCPTSRELARRLLAERELSIAMEGQRTEVKEALADGRLKQATVPGPLPWEKTEIADLPDGDRTAVSGTAAWIEGERVCRDLGGEVRSEEAAGLRLARIVMPANPGRWYAAHAGKVFWAKSVKHDGGIVVSWPSRVTDFIIEPQDVEYLEFLDLGS